MTSTTYVCYNKEKVLIGLSVENYNPCAIHLKGLLHNENYECTIYSYKNFFDKRSHEKAALN